VLSHPKDQQEIWRSVETTDQLTKAASITIQRYLPVLRSRPAATPSK